MARTFDSEMEQSIADEYLETEQSINQLAKKHFCSNIAITNIMKRRGIAIKMAPGKQKIFSDEQEQEIVREYEGGRTLKDLARNYSCSHECIRKILFRNGKQTRSRKEASGRRKNHFVCKECGETKKHYSKDFCGKCYNRFWRRHNRSTGNHDPLVCSWCQT